MMVSNQPDLVARLRAVEIHGLKERHFDLSADTFVTVSVDGEQQIQTEVIENNLNPQWTFKEPYTLMVHASSVISFQVYRRRHVAKVLGDKYIGELEQKLFTFVTNPNQPFDIDVRMNTIHWEKAQFLVVLEVDYNAQIEPLLDHAEDKMHNAMMKSSQAGPAAEALVALGHAIGSLDQLMGFVDGIVDIHPIAKAAWMLLSSVYKAFKFQAAQDTAIKELASSLMETLTHARSCRNVKTIPSAKVPLQELARLTAEGASLLDECIKHATILRAAKTAASKTLYNRINDCDHRLKKLQESLRMVVLMDIHNKVVDIKEDIHTCHAASSPPTHLSTRELPVHPQLSLPLSKPSMQSSIGTVRSTDPFLPKHNSSATTAQTADSLPIGHNYQPIYITPSGGYYTPVLPINASTPTNTVDRKAPVPRPASPWLPPLDTGAVRCASPEPMGPRPLPPTYASYPPPPLRPFSMPSPSSSLSSMSCFSMEDETKTASSQSSFPATPFDEAAPQCCPGQILPETPLVEEPEDGLCCDGAVGCKRSRSLTARKEVLQVGYAMLWGHPSDMVRAYSS